MKKETVSLNAKEQQRVRILNGIERGGLTGKEAAALMSLSVRQVRRLLAAYRGQGVVAVAHGNRGQRPAHALSEETKQQVVALAQGPFVGCNYTHLQELLVERAGMTLSRASVWRILTAAGLKSPRRRRPPRHRCRRERYPQEGMLLQTDGSHHAWLQGRGPDLTLLGAIDDATGTVPAALFRVQEDGQGYLLMLGEVIQHKGIPLALYSDRHSIFVVNPKQPSTLEEDLVGERQPTQVGRALRELGIQSILALSPQAKGRIERLWGTLQDRLVAELRLAGASTLEEANWVLKTFLPRFNDRFGVPPAQPGSAYRPAAAELDLAGVLCFKYQRTVAKDNTVRFNGATFQLLPSRDRVSYAHASVEVQERLDGSLVICYRGKTLASRPAPPAAPTLRARNGARNPALASPPPEPTNDLAPSLDIPRRPQDSKPWIPGPDHPWRKPLRVTKSQNH